MNRRPARSLADGHRGTGDNGQIVKPTTLPIALCLSVFIATPFSLSAGDSVKPGQPAIYDESANGDQQVADAVAIAGREQKHVLLQFGANWCGWCRKLHTLFHTDQSISDELRTNYIVALIDVNQDHNKNLAVKYGADQHGIPFLAVLGGDGKLLTTKDTGELEEGDHHSPQKVMAFLQRWAPGSAVDAPVRMSSIPKVTLVNCEALNGGLRRAYYKADNPSGSALNCRVHVEQVGGTETATFTIPAGGTSPFSFFVRPVGRPRITAEILNQNPVTQFAVPPPDPAP